MLPIRLILSVGGVLFASMVSLPALAPREGARTAAPVPPPNKENVIVAGLPAPPLAFDSDGDDSAAGTTIPIDIGEASSTELPLTQPDEHPPVVRTPARFAPARDGRREGGTPVAQ